MRAFPGKIWQSERRPSCKATSGNLSIPIFFWGEYPNSYSTVRRVWASWPEPCTLYACSSPFHSCSARGRIFRYRSTRRFVLRDNVLGLEHNAYAARQLELYLGGLLSLTCMVLLGFADDALNLKWRHKIWLPLVASIPILVVYYVNYGVTWVVVPKQLRPWLGQSIDLGTGRTRKNSVQPLLSKQHTNSGVLYYAYMACLSIFCTNAINILAGINGVEVGQTMVIVLAILANNLLAMYKWEGAGGLSSEGHNFSFLFMLPLLAVIVALWIYNRQDFELLRSGKERKILTCSTAKTGIRRKSSWATHSATLPA